MKQIQIKRDLVSLVSNADYKLISKYKWSLCKTYVRNSKLGFMHRFIIERKLKHKIPKGMECDHKNGNGLDNRRNNLRLATPSQNRINSNKKIGISGYRGVRWDKHRKRWRADIQFEGRKISLGRSLLKEECAKLYDKKAKELYGKFAFINFP